MSATSGSGPLARVRQRLRSAVRPPRTVPGPPAISIIVDMGAVSREAAQNTLFSLSRYYQRDIDDIPYEVIVVERRSRGALRRGALRSLGAEFEVLAADPTVDVAPLSQGLAAAGATVVGVVEGDVLVTPGVLRNVSDAMAGFPGATIVVPALALATPRLGQAGCDVLATTQWRQDGYELFTVAGRGDSGGWATASPCTFATRATVVDVIRRPDPAGDHQPVQTVVLAGEACVTQSGTGPATAPPSATGLGSQDSANEPILFGSVHVYAAANLHHDAVAAREEFEREVRSRPGDAAAIMNDPFARGTGRWRAPQDLAVAPSGTPGQDADGWQQRFGADLVAALRPRGCLQVGSADRPIYTSVRQAVNDNSLSTRCQAVAEPLPREAAIDPTDIDLLLIDGDHTYAATRAAFQRWYPHVTPGGVVLILGIDPDPIDFGVWRVWDELKDDHEEIFEFPARCGLGVLRKPGPELSDEPLLQSLFNSGPGDHDLLRRYYLR